MTLASILECDEKDVAARVARLAEFARSMGETLGVFECDAMLSRVSDLVGFEAQVESIVGDEIDARLGKLDQLNRDVELYSNLAESARALFGQDGGILDRDPSWEVFVAELRRDLRKLDG